MGTWGRIRGGPWFLLGLTKTEKVLHEPLGGQPQQRGCSQLCSSCMGYGVS